MTGRAFLKFTILLAILGIAGLAVFLRQDEEGIRSYAVERSAPKSRLLGAIIPRGQQAWFFKLTGSNKAVAEQSAAFRELIKSVKFAGADAAQPTWTLPKGWNQRPGSQMRFATLQVESGTDILDCSVTVLPMTGTNLPEYLLANINRWRDQLRLPPITESELASSTNQVKLSAEDLTATLVDFTGELSTSGMGQPSLASAVSTASGRPPMPGESKTSGPEKLIYDVPPGWTKGELNVSRGGVTVRRAAAFEVREGEQRLEITVTKLPASAMLANVNRWRSQIGLDSLSTEQFTEVKQQIEFSGNPADYVQFVGEKDAILGVISVRGREAWFVKLQGPSDLASREKRNFEAFVKSIRL